MIVAGVAVAANPAVIAADVGILAKPVVTPVIVLVGAGGRMFLLVTKVVWSPDASFFANVGLRELQLHTRQLHSGHSR